MADCTDKVYNANVTVTAQTAETNGSDYKITDNKEQITSNDETSYIFNAAEGEQKKVLFFKDDAGKVYQKELTINFDITAPELTISEPANVKDTTATISFTSSDDGKVYYVAHTKEDTPIPNAEAIKTEMKGEKQDDNYGIIVTASKPEPENMQKLTPDTTYYIYAVAEDKAGNLSEVKSISFTTAAAEKKDCEVAAPVFGSEAYSANDHTLTATVAADKEAKDFDYSLDGGKTWINGANGNVLTVDGTFAIIKLEEGKAYTANSIQIRVAETETNKAGDATAYDKAITAEITGTVTLSGTAKYGETITAEISGAPEDATLKYEFIRVTPKDTTGDSSEDNGSDSKDEKTESTTSSQAAEDSSETTEEIVQVAGESNSYTLTKEDIGAAIKVKVTAEGYDNYIESPVTDTVAKADAREVSVPEVASKEQTEDNTFTYTLKTLDGEDAQYAVVETDAEDQEKVWQGSPVFEGLKPETAYTFYVTYKSNDCYEDSEPQKLDITTPKLDTSKPQEAPEAAKVKVITQGAITAYHVQIENKDEADHLEYSVDGGNRWRPASEIEDLPFKADEEIVVLTRRFAYTAEDGTEYAASAYTTSEKVKTPSASEAPVITGTEKFNNKTTVTITAKEGSVIYYTIDGKDPEFMESIKYTGPIEVSATTTIRAIAKESGRVVSAVAEKTFTKNTSTSGGSTGGSTSGGSTSGGSTGGSTSGGSTSGGSTGSSTSGGSTSGSTTTPSAPSTPSGTQDTTTKTETKADGTQVTTTETKAADGSAQTTVALKNDAAGLDATVSVAKDAQGNVTAASAMATVKADGNKTAISANTVAQITEAAGTKDVAITSKVVDNDGNTVREVTVNAKNLTSGKSLKVVKVDAATGEKTLVNKTTYKVAKDGSLSLNNLADGNYEVITVSAANSLSKAVLKTVKVQNTKKTVSAGKKTKIALSKDLNMDNVAKVTYKTSKKSVATVSKNGAITTKKAGKATIKATVTLKNGKTKTVKMVVTVKAAK